MNADSTLTLAVPPEMVERIAERAAEILAARQTPTAASPWLTTAGAAEHLACRADRIHDLVQLGKLIPRRDGRRLLFRRADLDAYLEQQS
jgi:excisionase family DNA binding protein